MKKKRVAKARIAQNVMTKTAEPAEIAIAAADVVHAIKPTAASAQHNLPEQLKSETLEIA